MGMNEGLAALLSLVAGRRGHVRDGELCLDGAASSSAVAGRVSGRVAAHVCMGHAVGTGVGFSRYDAGDWRTAADMGRRGGNAAQRHFCGDVPHLPLEKILEVAPVLLRRFRIGDVSLGIRWVMLIGKTLGAVLGCMLYPP